jgi:hypothetical protein
MNMDANDKKLNKDHSSLGSIINYSSSNVMKDYALVTYANVFPGSEKSKTNYCSVNLELRSLSDGLEKTFWIKGEVEDIRKFLDTAKKGATINYLKGKVMEVYYMGGSIVQVKINKHALLEE